MRVVGWLLKVYWNKEADYLKIKINKISFAENINLIKDFFLLHIQNIFK